MTKERYIEILIKNIEHACSVANVTSNKLGIESGLGKDIVANLKKGSMLSADKLAEIANYLNVSVDYLLGRTDEPNSSMSNNSISATDIKENNVQTIGGNETISKRDRELLQKINSLSFDDYADIISYINSKIKSTI